MEMNVIQTEEEEAKVSLLADEMIIYMNNTKTPP